jgi:GDP-L-fucose synthase
MFPSPNSDLPSPSSAAPLPKIFIAGHRGMVGSAVVRALKSRGGYDIITRTHAELDLCDQTAVEAFFVEQQPNVVIHCAARVGGIHANSTYPAEFIHQNLAMSLNVIHSSWRNGTTRLLYLGSSCIYPREAPQPLKEEYLLTGPLEKTNEAYALAKIAGLKLCEHYRNQYGVCFHSAMPTNLYGTGDNYHPENSHVIPGLIRRVHQAKETDAPEVCLWGSGTPLREFLHVDDLAEAILYLLDLKDPPDIVNIGYGEDLSIRELAELVKETIGYTGQLVQDTSKPDGTPRKLLDTSRIRALGWEPRLQLKEGLARTYQEFLEGGHQRTQ